VGATSIVDLGCGTGLISRALAADGHRVTGVDPAPGMLAVARRSPLGDLVRWIEGDASRLDVIEAALAIMTGHVAQFFLTDEDWMGALTALRAALRPGGRLAFESRDPRARAWEAWTPAARRSVVDPTAGRVDTWCELHEVHDGLVSSTIHYRFAATGEELLAPTTLRFRTREELERTLAAAGFAVEHVYGDWDRRPVGPTTPELIVVALR
jgi:SAM-dependent methyltransferase